MRYAEVVQYLTEIMADHEFHKRTDLTKKEQYHYVTLFTHVVMDVNSFLDEFHKRFEQEAEEKYKTKIQSIKRIVKPVLDKISEWKELARMRHEMIAHNWRDNKGKFIIDKLGGYNAPRTFHDLLYLDAYIVLIKAVIMAEFSREAKEFASYIGSVTKQFEAPKANPDFEGEIRKLVAIVNNNTTIEEKSYKFDAEKLLGNVDEFGNSLPVN